MNRFCSSPLVLAPVAALLLALCSQAVAAEEKGPVNPVKWEYKMVPEITLTVLPDKSGKEVRLTEADLNKLGDEGWELCGVVSKTGSNPLITSTISTEVYFVFKRPKR